MTDNGIGPQFPQPDRRGWLAFRSLPAELQRREDATQAADHARSRPNDYEMAPPAFDRPATDTERALLAHLGYTVPEQLTTRVQWISPGVRNRCWPQ